MADEPKLLLEDDESALLLEDGTDALLLEGDAPTPTTAAAKKYVPGHAHRARRWRKRR